jgi:hypothetical protein
VSPHRLVGLYPATWRARYGEEFLALLEERPPRRFDVIDVAWGALDAHLFPQAPEGRFRMFTRIAGLAGIGAGAALLIGFLGFITGVNGFTVPTFYALAVIGLVGIHLRQVATRPLLAWLAFAVTLVGLGWGITGIVLSGAGVLPPSGGEFSYLGGVVLWLGLTALGAAMLTIRVFPVVVGLALAIGAPIGMIGLLANNAGTAGSVLDVVAQLGIVLVALGWVGAGISLVTAQPQEGVLGPAA